MKVKFSTLNINDKFIYNGIEHIKMGTKEGFANAHCQKSGCVILTNDTEVEIENEEIEIWDEVEENELEEDE